MLKTPQLRPLEPTLAMIVAINSNRTDSEILGEGLIQIGHYSSDIMLYGRNGDWDLEVGDIPTYGVCDSPEQFCAKFKVLLESDPRELAVFFTHIRKDPSNKGRGGGWRWHKWGEYVGLGEPTREYLDDEEGFDAGVFVYHIHDINWKPTR